MNTILTHNLGQNKNTGSSLASPSIITHSESVGRQNTVDFRESNIHQPRPRLNRVISSSPRNPCPVCDRTKDGDCRIGDDVVFCHTYADVKKFTRIGEYTCIKESNGHTATFKITRGFIKETPGERKERIRKQKQEKAHRDAQLAIEKQARIQAQLSEQDREYYYRRLTEELTLSDKHRESLLSRGYTEEWIKSERFVSIPKNYRPQVKLPYNFPGLHPDGYLINPQGILAPHRNHNNNTITAYIALDDRSKGKYKPLSYVENQHHYNAEQPICSKLPEVKSERIFVAEGGGLKSTLASLRLDIPVIMPPSGNLASSPKNSQDALNYASEKYGTDVIAIAPDAGDATKPEVVRKWINQYKFLESLGFEPFFAWWNQLEKGVDPDIDELENLVNVTFMKLEQFLQIAETHGGVKSAKDELDAIAQEKANAALNAETLWYDYLKQNWINSRKFTADIVVNQRYLDLTQVEIPPQDCIVAIRSGLGTGKTQAYLAIAKEFKVPFNIIGYRNTLLFQTIERGGKIELQVYHLNDDGGVELVADSGTNQALCVDSILKVDGYFKGRDIYLDETCSVLIHMINAGTLGDNQAPVIKAFTRALKDCNRVFLLDANLSDLYVNFIHSICPEKGLLRIQNEYQGNLQKFNIVDGIDAEEEIKKKDKSPMVRELLDSKCRPWIFSESKTFAKALHAVLTKLGKTGRCLTSETVNEPWAKEFLFDPDAFIQKEKPDYIIGSPSMESGISVSTRGYFTDKFSFLPGIGNINTQTQSMFRLRDPDVPHYVFCPEKSQIVDRSTPRTYFANQYKEFVREKVELSARLSDRADFKRELEKAYSRQIDDWFEFAAKLAAFDTFEQNHKRECLIYALKEMGHEVIIQQSEIDTEINEVIKEGKEENQKEESREIFKSHPIVDEQGKLDLDKATKLSKKSPLKEVQRAIDKTFLLHELPGIGESEIWCEEFILHCRIKNRHFVKQQENFWLLSNFEESQKRHEDKVANQVTSPDFFSTRMLKNSHDAIWALNELKVLELLELSEYHRTHPQVVWRFEAVKNRRDLQTALGMYEGIRETAQGKEVMELIGKLLEKIGYKNLKVSQKRVNEKGEKTSSYKAVPIGTGNKDFDFIQARECVLKAIENRYKNIQKLDVGKINEKWDGFKLNEIKEEFYAESPSEWLSSESVQNLSQSLLSCEDNETLNQIVQTTPRVAIVAALSLIPDQYFDQPGLLNELLSNLKILLFPDSPQIRLFGVYQRWIEEDISQVRQKILDPQNFDESGF